MKLFFSAANAKLASHCTLSCHRERKKKIEIKSKSTANSMNSIETEHVGEVWYILQGSET